MRLTPVLASLLVLGSLSTSVATAAPPRVNNPRACFLPDDIRSWKDGGGLSLNVRTGRHDIYNLRLIGDCAGIDWSDQLAVIPRIGTRICEGDDAVIVAPQALGRPLRCRVDRVRKLSQAEISGLAKKNTP